MDALFGEPGENSLSNAVLPTVHLVDDDEAVRDSLRFLLESYGFEVRDYESGTDFLKATRPVAPACVLLDLHLPVLGGLGLLHSLRKRDVTVPVILITGGGDKETRERAIRAGAMAFLDKPVREDSLIPLIERALALSSEEAGKAPAGAIRHLHPAPSPS
jgi:two-component system response regulator FixJ